jgi:sugar lactone lactonase YvrE
VGGIGGSTRSTSVSGGVSLGDDEDLEDLSVLRFTVDGKPQVLRLSTPEIDADEDEKKAEPAKKTPEKPAPAKNGRKPQPAGKSVVPKPDDKDDKDEKDDKPAAKADSKLVARQATVWTQTSQADFERGTALNTAVSTNGEVRLVPGLKLMHEDSEQFVWSVTGTGGAVYAGTGNGGQVLKVDAEGKPSVFFRTSELEVHAVARDKAGNVYAGTSPNGKVFRIAPDGNGTEILAINGKAGESEEAGKFVLSLAVADDGTVYAGTGPEGKIYRIKPGAPAEDLCTLPTKHVTSLLLTADALYAGTAEEGSIFRVSTTGPGVPKMVYDTPQAVITGLARDRQGNLYAACAPSGEIYKIEPDGTPTVHFNKSKGALYGLIIDQGGNLMTCSANSIMRVEQDGTATILSDKRNGQFTCIAWDETGRIVAGSANIGSVYRLTPTVSGAFESTVHDAKLPARWGRIRFTAMVPDSATLGLETRSGNTPDPDVTWSAWEKPTAREGSMFVSSPEARFLQYRVLFQAEQGSPALRDISIYYMSRNQAPKLTLATPVGGEVLKGSYTVKWSAADPDSDTLTYEVEYSSDGGRTWKSAGEKPTSSAAPAKPEASTRPTRASAAEALKRYREQLDADKSMTPAQRDENYNKAKALVEKYLDEDPPAAAGPRAPAAPTVSVKTGSTRVAQITWDTTDLPDGIYQLRVTATDKASNPGEPLSDSKVTEPFIVSNTPPQLFVFSRGIEVDAAKKSAVVTGFGSGRVALKGAEFRLGTGEWTAIEAEDGIWDSANEHFRFPLADLSSGEQSLEVKLVDTAGNASITRVKFKVP